LWERVTPRDPEGTRFVGSADDTLLRHLCTPGGVRVWREISSEFPHAYVDDLKQQARRYASAKRVTCP
jgi:hypothetical protein